MWTGINTPDLIAEWLSGSGVLYFLPPKISTFMARAHIAADIRALDREAVCTEFYCFRQKPLR